MAVPITVPLLLRKEMLPVQEAAVPLDDAAAILTAVIWAVSLAARPTGGKSCVLVTVLPVVELWAGGPAPPPRAESEPTSVWTLFDLVVV